MNLQVAMPHKEPCLKKCPFCIADITDNKDFDILPVEEYKHALIKELSENEYDAVVITGTNEPWQSPRYLVATIAAAKRTKTKIELTTSIPEALKYNPSILEDIDVLVLSMYQLQNVDFLEELRSKYKFKTRLVFIMSTLAPKPDAILRYVRANNIQQLTYKQLAGENDWIKEHKIPNEHLEDYENHLKNMPENRVSHLFFPNLPKNIIISGTRSIKFDYNCQEAPGRYRIFRADGEIYSNWEDKISRKEKIKQAFKHIKNAKEIKISYDEEGWYIYNYMKLISEKVYQQTKNVIKKGISTYKEALNLKNYKEFK